MTSMKSIVSFIFLWSFFALTAHAQDSLAITGPDYYLEGVQAFNREDLEKARKLFEATLELEPQHDAAWYYLGRIYALKNDRIEAEHYLQKAHHADTSNYWYTAELAKFYASSTHLEQAATLYEELLSKHPNKFSLYSDLLNLYTNAQQYEQALATLDRLDQVRGENEWTSNFRFELYRMQGRYEDAFRLLEKLEKTYPSAMNSYYLGELYLNQRQDSLAIQCYERALRLDPTYTPAHFGLAETYRTQGNYPNFLQHIQEFLIDPQMNPAFKAEYIDQVLNSPSLRNRFQNQIDTLILQSIQQHPTDSTLLYTTGNYFLQTGRTNEGVNFYARVIENYPNHLNPHIQYLYLLYYLQRWEDLEKQCQHSLGYLPGNFDIRQLQAIANWQLGAYDRSIQQYKALLRDLPKDRTDARLMCHSALGDLYQSIGEHKKAYAEYEKALKIQPDYLQVLNNYAYYLSLNGKKLQKAAEMSQRCVKAEPDNPTYLDTYGWILYLLGRYEEAIAQFKRAMLFGGNQSAVILDHYADSLFAIGEKALALIYWEQADRLDPTLGAALKIDKHSK